MTISGSVTTGSRSVLASSNSGSPLNLDGSAILTAVALGRDITDVLSAVDAMTLKGGIDCSANPDYPAADAGHLYKVTVAGRIGTRITK